MNLKSIAAAAFFIAAQAHAGDLFYAANQANGAIVLTDSQSSCAQGSKAYYTTDAGGHPAPGGCWSYSDPWVIANGVDGQTHQWMAIQFTETDYAKSKYGTKSNASM